MGWKFPISTNSGLSLGTNNNVFVAEGILVASEIEQSIVGTGTNHRIEVFGTVLGFQDGISLLSDFATTITSHINIGDTGHVITTGSVGINIWGAGGTIENSGEIRSYQTAVFIRSQENSTVSTVLNDGVIKGEVRGISFDSDASSVTKIVNTGLISATTAIGSDSGENLGQDTVINKGSIVGQIKFDAGDDKYDGRSGSIKGEIFGGAGIDTILGGKEKNIFLGDGGADKLQGGLGADKLTGGADGDLFIFKATAESTVAASGRDTILDFTHAQGDAIDLSAIDANSKKAGNQAFDFIDSQSFHGVAGELRFQKSSTDTFVYGDVDGDRKADFAIKLTGLITLVESDFIL
jgi:Ca2+-binding RTX toxin-like protein